MRLSYTPPPGWDFATVGDLAKPEKGSIRIGPFGSALKKHEYSENGIRVLGIEDVHPNQFLSDRCKYIPNAKFCELRQYEVSDGDVLVTNMGTVGRACAVPAGTQRSIISSHLIKVSLNRSRADPNYLCWMLNYSPLVVAQIRAKSHGAIMAGFNSSLLKSLRIPLPPLAEQKRIAGILDAADALRAKRREALGQLDTLLQSTFLDMFGDPVTNPMGWPPTSLSAISEELRDGPFGSNLKTSHYVESGVRVIRLQNIGVGEIRNDDLAFISEEHFASLPRNHCQPGDVIIGTMGDPNLRACIVPLALARSLNKADCILMRVDMTKVDAIYVCWLLNNPCMVSMALRLVRGQTRGRISLGRLKELQIHLPPIKLQLRFAAIVQSVEHQKANQRAHLAELDTLFASLQSRAFRGDL